MKPLNIILCVQMWGFVCICWHGSVGWSVNHFEYRDMSNKTVVFHQIHANSLCLMLANLATMANIRPQHR